MKHALAPATSIAAAFLALACSLPASAAQEAAKEAAKDTDRPVAEREPSAADVATTPLGDLNLRKDEIPALLLKAQETPYDLTGLRRCREISAAVTELDAALGDDIDLPQEDRRGPSIGRLAQWTVARFIPFRGAIRELSGASAHERRMGAAIRAGLVRRGYLKGIGEARGCRYPARSATPAVIARIAAEREAARQEADKPDDAKSRPESGEPKGSRRR